MRISTMAVVLIIVFRVSAYADSTSTTAPTITVTTDRFLGAARSATPVAAFDRQWLDRMQSVRLADVLALAPGVAIRDYGGLGGMRTVSIRGGSSAQTLVLVDGIRLSTVQNGVVDLSLLPTSMVGSVDVLRGGAAALYGANALSGVIDIRLARPSASGLRLGLGTGAFEEERWNATASIVGAGVTLTGGVDVLSTRGSYPFTTQRSGDMIAVNRENGDARTLSAVLSAVGPTWSVVTLLRSGHRGVPGPVIAGSVGLAKARLDDDDMMVGGRWSVLTDSTTSLVMTSGLHVQDQVYRDPDATVFGPRGIDQRYVQRDLAAGVVWQMTAAASVFRLRADASFADLRGAMLQPGVGDRVQRRGLAAAGEAMMPLPSLGYVHLALRGDAISDAGTAVSPLVAVLFDVAQDVALRASWSMGFRPASFNELYYLNYGTASLRPERGTTTDLGVVWQIAPGIVVDADVYLMDTRDLILGVPTSPVATSARNVARASTAGMEWSFRTVTVGQRLQGTLSYTLQDVRDRSGRAGIDGTLLPYAPQELVAAALAWKGPWWSASAQWQYTSFRYAQPGEEYPAMLPSYGTLHCSVGAQGAAASTTIDVRLQCDNVLDQGYAVVRGFPMPGRAFRLLCTMGFQP